MTGGPLEFTVERNATPVSDEVRASVLNDPPFGQFHTDHMVSIDWGQSGADGKGWHNARVIPYGPIELDPSAIVLHYAQEIFEGLKAYRWADGSIVSFRPEEMKAKSGYYNYRRGESGSDREGASVFYKGEDGAIFHTYSTYARGIDLLNLTYNFLDLTPKGRDESHLAWTQEWVRHHDKYASRTGSGAV